MFAELTDVRCYYELLGSGDPLLLIPGLGTTTALWEPAVGELSQHFSLVLFDNRGVGRSVAKRTPHMLSDLAVDVIELMDHLQLDRLRRRRQYHLRHAGRAQHLHGHRQRYVHGK